jgi:hypothetical protein
MTEPRREMSEGKTFVEMAADSGDGAGEDSPADGGSPSHPQLRTEPRCPCRFAPWGTPCGPGAADHHPQSPHLDGPRHRNPCCPRGSWVGLAWLLIPYSPAAVGMPPFPVSRRPSPLPTPVTLPCRLSPAAPPSRHRGTAWTGKSSSTRQFLQRHGSRWRVCSPRSWRAEGKHDPSLPGEYHSPLS